MYIWYTGNSIEWIAENRYWNINNMKISIGTFSSLVASQVVVETPCLDDKVGIMVILDFPFMIKENGVNINYFNGNSCCREMAFLQ